MDWIWKAVARWLDGVTLTLIFGLTAALYGAAAYVVAGLLALLVGADPSHDAVKGIAGFVAVPLGFLAVREADLSRRKD